MKMPSKPFKVDIIISVVFTTNSILLQKNDKEDRFSRIPIYNKEDIKALNFNHTTLYLSEIALEKCKSIKNIDEEIHFLRSL